MPYEHVGSIRALAERWPDVTIVLGHAGQPVERTPEYLARWSQALADLAAAASNVVVKVSAIAPGADPHWTVDCIRPCVLGCVGAFGAERSMFATNRPIDRLHGTYGGLVGAYREITADLAADERKALFHRLGGPRVPHLSARPGDSARRLLGCRIPGAYSVG